VPAAGWDDSGVPATTAARLRLRTVRSRSVAAAVVVVGAALVVGVVLLLVLLQRTLIADVEAEAIGRARDVAALVRADGPARLDSVLVDTTRTEQVVQVVDGTDRVIAASSERARSEPLTTLRPPAGTVAPVHTGRIALLDTDSPFVVVVASVVRDGATYRVIVAESIRAEQHSVGTVLSLLSLGLPLLLSLVALAAWVLIGRALRPVERIRAQVARIGSTGQLDQRVPLPGTHDEIARLAETMNEMLGRLESARTTQRRFVADAGHELRSPVAGIAAVLEVARVDPGGSTLTELEPVLAAETDRIGRLIENLLLLAAVDEQAASSTVGDVDLDELIDAEVLRLRARPDLRVQHRVTPVRIQGDRNRLAQVVANLGDNAARHARSVVRLDVHLDPDDADGPDGPDVAVIRVEDDGPGIPVADRSRVFDRFVRLDDSRQRTSGGSGLGLSIVRELVAAHGGTVQIDEADGGGCRVEVRLPAHGQPISDAGQPPSGSSR
jgi:signal transduction histidine kinase